MKNKIRVVLVVLLSLSLFACNSQSKREEKPFEKVKKAMIKNDSFSLNVNFSAWLENELIGEELLNFKFNNFFDEEDKEGSLAFIRSVEGLETNVNSYYKKDMIMSNENDEMFLLDKEDLSFHSWIEFFAIFDSDNNYVKSVKLKEINKKKTLEIELNLDTKSSAGKYIYNDENVTLEDDVKKTSVILTLNDDYTIQNCETSYHFATKDGLLIYNTLVDFSNYGHQDIPFPEGM